MNAEKLLCSGWTAWEGVNYQLGSFVWKNALAFVLLLHHKTVSDLLRNRSGFFLILNAEHRNCWKWPENVLLSLTRPANKDWQPNENVWKSTIFPYQVVYCRKRSRSVKFSFWDTQRLKTVYKLAQNFLTKMIWYTDSKNDLIRQNPFFLSQSIWGKVKVALTVQIASRAFQLIFGPEVWTGQTSNVQCCVKQIIVEPKSTSQKNGQ